MTGRIVAGVDGSQGSRRALIWALEEAKVRKARLEAAIVWQGPYDFPRDVSYPVDEHRLVEEARTRLSNTIAEIAGSQSSVEVDPVLLEGDPAEALCHRAATADLLVVGSRGHGAFVRLLLGSVSAKCAHHRRSPLVIVQAPRRGDEEQRFQATRRIVVGIDGSPGSLRALRWAVDEAAARRSDVEALMVWRGIEADDDMAPELASFPSVARHDRATADRAALVLQRIVSEALSPATLGVPGAEVQRTVLEGDPAEVLCQHAATADLLVVGARGHGSFTELLLGSVSDRCAHHSRSPLVIVP